MNAPLQRICVYCASSPGTNVHITKATRELGALFASEGIELVYGGGAVGLMGLLADTVMDAGGKVTGVIPAQLFPTEVAHRGITTLEEVGSMHQRKTRMFELSDAFIALPGGFGTLEEIAEITTWAQIGVHSKPVGLLNVDGYYDTLLSWLDRAIGDGLLKQGSARLLRSAGTPQSMLDVLRS